MSQAPHTIDQLLSRVRRRLRLQKATRWLVRALSLSGGVALVALVLMRLYWLSPSVFYSLAVGLSAFCTMAFFLGLLGRYDRVVLAQRLDQTHDLKDRLGTAVAMASEESVFAAAQRREAATHVSGVDAGRAAPWFVPLETLAVMGLVGLIWVVGAFWPSTWIPSPTEPVVQLVALDTPPPVEEPPPPLALDEEELDLVDVGPERLSDEWQEMAATDPEMARFVEEMNKVLEAIAEGKLTPKEVAEKTAALEEQADALAGEPEALADQEALAQKFDALAEEMEKAAKKLKQKDLEELAKLLEERRYEEAGALFEKLMERFLKLPPKEQRRLAKAFEKLAKKLKSNLANKVDKARKKKSRLAQKNQGAPGPNKKRRSRLNRAQKKLDQLQRQYDKSTPQAQKELDRLSRAMQKAADRLRRQQPKPKQVGQGEKNQPKPAEKSRRLDEKTLKELTEAIKRLGNQQKRSRLGRMGKMRMADLKELLRRRRQGAQKKRSKLARLRRGKKGKGQMGSSQKSEKGSGGLQRKGLEWMRVKRGGKRGPLSQKQARIGEGAGQGHHPLSHRRGTELARVKTRPDFVPGQRGKGPTKVEVLYGAATEGTRVKGYGPIHIDYSMRASRQMAQEEVPPGYRSVVEEYFRLIRQ